MRGASEVITFCYGTFSCRLEGFEDPFDTMKAITTYFREFASGAHAGGSAPASPDATRLREIAERKNNARIEVETLADGFVLRATSAAATSAAAISTHAPEWPCGKILPGEAVPADLQPNDTRPDASRSSDTRSGNSLTDEIQPGDALQSRPKDFTNELTKAELTKARESSRSTDVETIALHSSAGIIHIRLGSALAAALPANRAARDTAIGGQSANSRTEDDGVARERDIALTPSRSEAMRETDRGGDDPAAPADSHPIHTARPSDKKAPRLGDATDAAVERLIAQTNTVMEVPEIRRRHSAIAHLKAAVAATKAAVSDQPRSNGRKTNPEDPYRDDLEIAVRPQRHCKRSSTPGTNITTPGTEEGNPAPKNPTQEKAGLPDAPAPAAATPAAATPAAATPEAATPEAAAKPDETASGSETHN